MYQYKNLQITKYLHDGFRIEGAGKIIYFDPFKIPNDQPKADYIFLSHEHFDHLDVESIRKILDVQTIVVGNSFVKSGLQNLEIANFVELKASDEKEFPEFKVNVVAAYNINKFREEGRPFHPQENGGLGFILEFKTSERIYHTGDTDFIPEMKDLKNIDVMMVPISGTYVMTPDEAAEAVNFVNPKIVIPMHFDGGIIGGKGDVEILKSKIKSEVVVLEPEK